MLGALVFCGDSLFLESLKRGKEERYRNSARGSLRRNRPVSHLKCALEAVAESEGDGRVVLERRELVVDFGLFRVDVRLHRGVGCGIDAGRSVEASVAGQVQLCARGSLKDDADLEIESEMAGGRNEVAKSEHYCRRDFQEVQLAGAGDGTRGIARVGYATKGERTATGNVGRGRSAVAVVEEQAGTQVEGIAEGIPVQMRFSGPEIKLALVGDPVVTKAAAVLKKVEASAKIQAVGQGNGGLPARTQGRKPHAHANVTGVSLRRMRGARGVGGIVRCGALAREGSRIQFDGVARRFGGVVVRGR